MKFIKILTAILFSLVIILPLAAFNFTENASSEIDNRMLAENPFSKESLSSGEELFESIENYVDDRIGFRDKMILGFTEFNDKVFSKMVHPCYTYGKDGYVFGSGLTTVLNPYTDFHEEFADTVKSIQDYCTQRGVPFIFIFNPAKPAVLSEYIPTGINYDRSWVDQFFAALDEREVRYIDNTVTLREKTEQGEAVFNQKYDANHWNDLGAYYGTNAALLELQKDFPEIELNDINDFTLSENLMTSLPVSQFTINELVPGIDLHLDGVVDLTDLYSYELEIDPSFRDFRYYQNTKRVEDGAPNALVFQGSYMIKYGYKYLINAFGDYAYVHDYENILDFDYYYNIFKPDCVILEVAEYTLTPNYYDYDRMTEFKLNPTVDSLKAADATQKQEPLNYDDIYIESGDALTTLTWNTDQIYDYVWLFLDSEYDMRATDSGYEVTFLAEDYSPNMKPVIVAYDGDSLIYFK